MPVTTAYTILCFSSSFESKVIFTILEEEIMNFSVTFVMIIKIVALKPATAAALASNRLELGSTNALGIHVRSIKEMLPEHLLRNTSRLSRFFTTFYVHWNFKKNQGT